MFYRWSEVAPWLRQHLETAAAIPDVDAALVYANLIVQARQLRRRVEQPAALTDLLAA